ncbi:uncharacterized protein LOC122648340 isoform X2 [Telopea speciosissima]|uniref:uncharacterized protein LOC122648340 isoform X2 n=1 Tax=Telopea speciosissima TaxID=54955 RepID=UPI001CC65437|nr:uncharacterized protein LOC122648340 isoform X2 [Telopea speciosissima]
MLLQNAKQKDLLIKMIKYVEQSSGHQAESADVGSTELLQISPASAREKELQAQVIHLQQSIDRLVEELQRLKMINAQLERQFNAV